MGRKNVLRLAAHLNFSLLLLIGVFAVEICGLSPPIFTETAIVIFIVIFLMIEVGNVLILYKKGQLFFLTCPILWAKALTHYSSVQSIPFFLSFLLIVFSFKVIELCLSMIKRRRKQIFVQDYFSQSMELRIITSFLFDIAALSWS